MRVPLFAQAFLDGFTFGSWQTGGLMLPPASFPRKRSPTLRATGKLVLSVVANLAKSGLDHDHLKGIFASCLSPFFDGFGFIGLFTRLRRPGSPESYFRRDEDVSPDFPAT